MQSHAAALTHSSDIYIATSVQTYGIAGDAPLAFHSASALKSEEYSESKRCVASNPVSLHTNIATLMRAFGNASCSEAVH